MNKLTITIALYLATAAFADPCGMVPPLYDGPGVPIVRAGEQQTYVFYKDGVESFVIRPGFTGKVEDFGMLIPFPNPPAIRKVSDEIFPHVAAAVDPPEVVIDVAPMMLGGFFGGMGGGGMGGAGGGGYGGAGMRVLREDEVRVVSEEAVGMYEVAVLEAGSPKALKKWMDENGYRFPDGMERVCNDYVEDRWCFVAVKTKVAGKSGVDPKPGQRNVNAGLPAGGAFDGFVQAMGFRFKSKELVVPMRLSAFNDGDLRNIVYLLTEAPCKVRFIPSEFVRRQVKGADLIRNLTDPLPLRIVNGGVKDLNDSHRKGLAERRDPRTKNGAARELFTSDVLAVRSGELALPHEEEEKTLLKIGERLGLRGGDIDKLNNEAINDKRSGEIAKATDLLDKMTLTVVDGDFPRRVISRDNITFTAYQMAPHLNSAFKYDAKTRRPRERPQRKSQLIIGAISEANVERPTRRGLRRLLGSLSLVGMALMLWSGRKGKRGGSGL